MRIVSLPRFNKRNVFARPPLFINVPLYTHSRSLYAFIRMSETQKLKNSKNFDILEETHIIPRRRIQVE